MKSVINLILCFIVMLMAMLSLLSTPGVSAAGHPTPECEQLEALARQLNVTSRHSLIGKDCLQNSHCTGINCNARFKTQDSSLPSSWLQPFCYAFELMSCSAPLQVLVRLIDSNIQSTNYTYYFNSSEIRPVDKFKAKIQNAVNIQLYLNVTFRFDPHKRSAVFGMMTAIEVQSRVFGNYQSFPDWGKQELVPVTTFTVAECTPETNITVSYNPCSLVPKLPDVDPTKSSPIVLGNCNMNTINSCGHNQMCQPDLRRGRDAGFCTCAIDAKYNKATKSCDLNDRIIPSPPSNSSAVIPTPQATSSGGGGNSKLGLYIGVGVIVVVLLLTAATVVVFYLRKRGRYRGRTRVLMVDDGLDTALMSDEDDMPINL